jgi:hypothetical protein
MILTVLVAASLVLAVVLLARGLPDAGATTEVTVTVPSMPGQEGTSSGDEEVTITLPVGVSVDDLENLAGALAAVITALTGLFGLVATQVWRRREENRTDKSHTLALEKERLAMERERLEMERERLELARQREALRPSGGGS